MYNGVKAMIAREKELDGSANQPQPAPEVPVKAGSHLKSATDITGFPEFPPGTTSLLSKYLTKEVWDKLKDSQDACGFTFKQAIFSGV
jgi:hypothetical protein